MSARSATVARAFRPGLFALAVLATLTLTGQGCSNTRPCRKGTVFLTVKVGTVDADHVVVTVAVDGTAGSPTALPLKGAKSGGVEITFASGYVENKSVSVTASLEKDGVPVGTPQTTTTRLAQGCTALEVDFDRGDAGATDAAAATGGRGTTGTGGGAGGTGGAGAMGTGGASAGTGGAAGTGTGGVASGGAAGGVGGATGGRGGAGTGGRASGGTMGTGGAVATGGSGAGTGGAGGRACTPTATAENCFNNVDDDCNGLIDCADTAGCMPTSQCQALDATLGMIGASVASTAACPTGAPTQRTLNSGLMATACTGCTCGPGTVALTCSAQIYGYGTAAEATAGCATNTGGTLVATLMSTQACTTPNWGTATGSIYGIRASLFAGTASGTCVPGGTATKGSPVWGSTAKFCAVAAVGGGCAAGQVCVPRPVVAAGACLLLDGAKTCPAGLRQSAWYAGFADTRTCGACTCGAPTGGDCGSMLIGTGNDYSCPPSSVLGYVRTGDHLCLPNGNYSPGLQFSGTPVAPTCAPASAVSGAVTASGPQTLCCI